MWPLPSPGRNLSALLRMPWNSAPASAFVPPWLGPLRSFWPFASWPWAVPLLFSRALWLLRSSCRQPWPDLLFSRRRAVQPCPPSPPWRVRLWPWPVPKPGCFLRVRHPFWYLGFGLPVSRGLPFSGGWFSLRLWLSLVKASSVSGRQRLGPPFFLFCAGSCFAGGADALRRVSACVRCSATAADVCFRVAERF